MARSLCYAKPPSGSTGLSADLTTDPTRTRGASAWAAPRPSASCCPRLPAPFFARLAAAIEEAADRAGLGLVLSATLNRQGRELDYIERMRRNDVDGLIFVTNHPDDGTLRRALNTTPGTILLDEDVPGAAVPKVFCDNEQGGFLAGQHLLTAGHRQIAYIGGPSGLMSTRERRAGLDRAVAAVPGAAVVWESFGPYTVAEGAGAAAALLRSAAQPSAIFAASDELVLGLLPVLCESGLRIPDEISIVGFDDIGPLHLLDPPVSAIRQPVAEIGERAVALLTAAGSARPIANGFPSSSSSAARSLPACLAQPCLHQKRETETMIRLTRRTTFKGLSAGALLGPLAVHTGRAATATFALVTINEQALFFNQLNDGANQAAAKAGVNLVIYNPNNDPTAEQCYRRLHPADGAGDHRRCD
jgi:LacI family transcriptional regulator